MQETSSKREVSVQKFVIVNKLLVIEVSISRDTCDIKKIKYAKKSRGGRMKAAKARAKSLKGGKGHVKNRKAGKHIMRT